MISGIFHDGSGLGNQLFRYITTRTIAEDKGWNYGMIGQFKGDFFLEQPKIVPLDGHMPTWVEKCVRDENGVDIRSYDPEINFVSDNTIVEGEFQDQRYWGHKMDKIKEWLKVEPLALPGVCVIGFRGGEYYSDPNLGLPESYYRDAMEKMKGIDPTMKFEVHTDDPALAHTFFPELTIVDTERISHSKHTNMSINWRAMRYASFAIIANSSFYVIPRLLSKGITIAPRYWARRNTGVWALPQNYYKEFQYL